MIRNILLFGAMALAICTGCRQQTPAPNQAGKVRVTVSIFPIADVVRQIGREHVEVTTLLEGGASPHGFQLKPYQAQKLAQSNVVILVGLGLDEWARHGLKLAGQNKALVLTMASNVQIDATTQPADGDHAGHDHADCADHNQPSGDPHIWLDPVLMEQFTAAIAEALAVADPLRRNEYFQNRQEYVQQLRQLDSDYRTRLAGVKHKHLVTFHEAFSYVANRYGLEHIALMPPSASGFTPQRLSNVSTFIDEHRVSVIFIEPQMPPESFEQLRRQKNVRIARLDPLGGPGVKGYDSYINLMRSNLETMAEELNK